MSVAKEQLANARDKKGKRGSTNNKRRLDAFGAGKGKARAGWQTCHSELLLGVVVGITALGGALTIGLSRDKGAHFMTLLLDDERETLWFNGDANLDEALGEVLKKLDEMAEQ